MCFTVLLLCLNHGFTRNRTFGTAESSCVYQPSHINKLFCPLRPRSTRERDVYTRYSVYYQSSSTVLLSITVIPDGRDATQSDATRRDFSSPVRVVAVGIYWRYTLLSG